MRFQICVRLPIREPGATDFLAEKLPKYSTRRTLYGVKLMELVSVRYELLKPVT